MLSSSKRPARTTTRRMMSVLKVLERCAVLIAALAALFPMWQFYSEAQDRRIDRAANFILAQQTCDAFFSERERIADDRLAKGLPSESSAAIQSGEMSKGITVECEYIEELNRDAARSAWRW